MKKKLLFAAILAMGMIAVFNVSAAKQASGDIRLRNIEILSSGETGNDVGCFYIGSLDCPVSDINVAYIW